MVLAQNLKCFEMQQFSFIKCVSVRCYQAYSIFATSLTLNSRVTREQRLRFHESKSYGIEEQSIMNYEQKLYGMLLENITI